jgi:hypothetical protein
MRTSVTFAAATIFAIALTAWSISMLPRARDVVTATIQTPVSSSSMQHNCSTMISGPGVVSAIPSPSSISPGFWPAGTVARAYAANRRAAMEAIIDSDPVADFVRAMMTGRATWAGSASNLLLLCTQSAGNNLAKGAAWIRSPRAFAGRLRRAQTFLRAVGIEMTFSREGQTGFRMIRLSTLSESSVGTASTVSTARVIGRTISHADAADGTEAKPL